MHILTRFFLLLMKYCLWESLTFLKHEPMQDRNWKICDFNFLVLIFIIVVIVVAVYGRGKGVFVHFVMGLPNCLSVLLQGCGFEVTQ